MKTNEKRKFDTVQTTKYMYINKKAERLEAEKEEEEEENEVGLK